ncbi:MAG: formylglycine-generating enzyme family protein, partial [Planctomycetota bacterium]
MLSSNRIFNGAAGKCCKLKIRIGLVVLLVVSLVAFWAPDAPGKGKAAKAYTETVTTENGEKLSFDMVLVPGGTFAMGSSPDEPDHADDESPQHDVRLDPFYLCTTETTLEFFMAYYQETVTAKKEFEGLQEAKADAEPAGDVDAVSGP